MASVPYVVPKGRVSTPMNKNLGVGNETKGNPSTVQLGGSLAEAKGELMSQHPHHYSDHGPHHGTSDHIRHKPHVRPNGGYGR